MLALLVFYFVALINCQCPTDGSTLTAQTTYSTCQTSVFTGGLTGTAAADALCTCLGSYKTTATASAGANGCDQTTLTLDAYCAANTILSQVGIASSQYDWNTCAPCANPIPSPLWPTACSICLNKYTSCLFTGYYNLISYPSAASFFSLNQSCACLGQFYSCFAGCGSPVSGYLSDGTCRVYSFCPCDGTATGATGSGSAVVTYLKSSGFLQFHAYLTSNSGGAIVSVDCSTPTTQACSAGVCSSNTFICTINFASSVTYQTLHDWIGNFIGQQASICTGTFPDGLCVSLKRDALEDLQTGTGAQTFTIVPQNSNANSVIISLFSFCLVALFFLF